MATRKQIAAKRANAQKSTGPKTPEGKAARGPSEPPPPVVKTISAEQTQSGPEPTSSPITPNDLPPMDPPITGDLLEARAANSLTGGFLKAGHALHYGSIE